jgi:hypothetical protein
VTVVVWLLSELKSYHSYTVKSKTLVILSNFVVTLDRTIYKFESRSSNGYPYSLSRLTIKSSEVIFIFLQVNLHFL